MAKFNIELELDWLEEEQNFDEVLKEEIMHKVETRVIGNVIQELTDKLNSKLNDTLEERAEKVVDEFIARVLENKIETLKIPYKKNSWDSNVKMIPISEFVGMKYEEYLNKKVYDEHGRVPDYGRDGKLSINEYFINNYLEQELTKKVSDLIQKARKDAEETVVSTIEYQLREQLSADIISRLNIPKMLANLQEKAALLEGKNND